MEAAITFIALFITIFGLFYLFLTTRNRERMAMIEKGVDPALFANVRPPRVPSQGGLKLALKAGMLFVGIGVGFIVSVFLGDLVRIGLQALLVTGTIFVFGGLGLIAGFYLGRNLDKKDHKG